MQSTNEHVESSKLQATILPSDRMSSCEYLSTHVLNNLEKLYLNIRELTKHASERAAASVLSRGFFENRKVDIRQLLTSSSIVDRNNHPDDDNGTEFGSDS
eukprot:scaffold4659_cov80-Skeletonema_dohrnii-CCMP3373.AAC.4